MDYAEPVVVEQLGKGRACGPGICQRLADTHELADVGQKTPDHVELIGRPVVGTDRIANVPDDARATRPFQTHIETVLNAADGQHFVECRGSFQLLLGVEVGNVKQLAVGQLPETWDTFVPGEIVGEVLAFQFLMVFTAEAEPYVEDLNIIVSLSLGESQHVALRPAGVVDQGGGWQPVSVVEHGLVQRCQDAIERVSFVHDELATFVVRISPWAKIFTP